MNKVYIEWKEGAKYPKPADDFSPSEQYPEYVWRDDIASSANTVYDMVRNTLRGFDLDRDNYGKQEWNPLKSYMSPGNTVLIKPNFVMHYNENRKVKKNSMECLVTHASVIRAVCDYCVIALKGKGRIIIGDAPMQDCDFNRLVKKMHYDRLLDFYQKRGISISLVDFREYESRYNKSAVIIGRRFSNEESVMVDIGKESAHYSSGRNEKSFCVSDYDANDMKRYHDQEKHLYAINKRVLEADSIINLCKPKCHRLAGMTASMKNCIGIVFNKACLPHRTIGSAEEGGDEYLHSSRLKKGVKCVLDHKIQYEKQNKLFMAHIMRYLYGCLYYLIQFFGKDKYLLGSWYGNDTIWRTVYDLNYILSYANHKGDIMKTRQRKILTLADMIISGEGNGPVSPSPKELGMILISDNQVAADRVICEIMGFDYRKIPGLDYCLKSKLTEQDSVCTVQVNEKKLKGRIEDIVINREWHFTPHKNWKGYIEQD